MSYWKRSSQIVQFWLFSFGKIAFCGGFLVFFVWCFFFGFFFCYVTMIFCCCKWPVQVEPFRRMQRLLHSWRAAKHSQEGKIPENSGYNRQRNYSQKQEISSLCTDRQGIWGHTQSAVDVREQPAKPQSNGMKFLRAKYDCLDLHQLKHSSVG